MEAFVYRWFDQKTDKVYIGWHKGALDDGYICSSKIMLEQYNLRSEDFSREILATGNSKDMAELETALLKHYQASTNDKFYNMHNGNGLYFLKGHTEESKRKISEGHKGRKRPDLTKRNLENNCMKNEEVKAKYKRNRKYISGVENPTYGRKHTPDAKRKISESKIGKKLPAKSDVTKEKIRIASLNRKKESCKYCGKICSVNLIDRWHNENCKERLNAN